MFTAINTLKRKILNKQHNSTYTLRNKKKNKRPQVSRRKEILKIKADIDEIEKITKIGWFFEKVKQN